MLSPEIQTLLFEALRTLYMILLPLVVAISLSGALISFLQSASTVQEQALSYAVRLLAFVLMLYLLLPMFSESLTLLARRAFQ